MFTRFIAAPIACAGFLGIGYNRQLSFETRLLSFLRAAAGVLLLVVGVVLFFIEPAFAQFASNAPADASSVVSATIGTYLNPILETLGVILAACVTFFVGRLVSILPAWAQVLFTAAVQSMISNYVRQGIAWAIQEIEDFDKDKVISFDVGQAGVASALRYVLDHAPAFLVNLAGGKDAISQKIIAFLTEHGIVLDKDVVPQQVAVAAAKAA